MGEQEVKKKVTVGSSKEMSLNLCFYVEGGGKTLEGVHQQVCVKECHVTFVFKIKKGRKTLKEKSLVGLGYNVFRYKKGDQHFKEVCPEAHDAIMGG